MFLFYLICCVYFFKNKLHLFIWTQHRFIWIQIVFLFVCATCFSVYLNHLPACQYMYVIVFQSFHLFMLHLFGSFCITCNLAFLLWCVNFGKCCIMTMNIKGNINMLSMWMYVWVWDLCNICLCRVTEMRTRLWTHQLQELMHRH